MLKHQEKLQMESLKKQVEELIKIVASHTQRIAALERQMKPKPKPKPKKT